MSQNIFEVSEGLSDIARIFLSSVEMWYSVTMIEAVDEFMNFDTLQSEI